MPRTVQISIGAFDTPNLLRMHQLMTCLDLSTQKSQDSFLPSSVVLKAAEAEEKSGKFCCLFFLQFSYGILSLKYLLRSFTQENQLYTI